MATEMADYLAIHAQSQLPIGPTFEERLLRLRRFGPNPSNASGAPDAINPLAKESKTRAHRRKDEQRYRSRVRRGIIPNEKQKDDALARLARKTLGPNRYFLGAYIAVRVTIALPFLIPIKLAVGGK